MVPCGGCILDYCFGKTIDGESGISTTDQTMRNIAESSV